MSRSLRASRLTRTVLVLVSAFGLLPVLFLLTKSLDNLDAGRVLLEQQTWVALGRTLALGAATGLFSAMVALPLAWWTHATDLPGRRFFRVALNLPLAVPSYVGGFVILLAFAKGGLWESVLGRPVPVYGFLGAFLAISFSFPLALLNIQSALGRVDPRLWDAARGLGATPWRAFWKVIFPQLRPAMFRGGLLVALYALGDFGAVSLLRYRSLSYLIYVRFQSLFGREEALWLSVLLLIIAILFVGLAVRVGGHRVASLTTASTARSWPVIRLGRARLFAFAVCSAVVLCGVVLPVAVVLYWLVRGYTQGNPPELEWLTVWDSTWIAGCASAGIVMVAVIPTIVSRYARHAQSSWFHQLMLHMGYALPGIVVALSFISVSTQWLPFLYQTFILLFVAYAVRFLPLAIHTMEDALASQSQNLFRAARSLGCTPAQAVFRVILPEMKPAIMLAFAALFIAILKELPLTLLVRPIGTETFATQIWELTEDAYFGAASISVILLLAVATLGLLWRPRERTAK